MNRATPLLYIFARAPEPGRSKTRLIPRLGAAGAAALHAAMIEDVLGLSRDVGARRVLSAADRPEHPFLRQMAAREGIPLVAQSEGDLGARMAAAIAAGLGETERVCIIGSDSPTLLPAQIAAAFARLDTADVVLGPAEDGGYWLIGARRPLRLDEVLADTAWGTAAVLATTRARAERAGLRVALAEPHWDVDEPPDLERLGRVLAAEPTLAPATRAALAALQQPTTQRV